MTNLSTHTWKELAHRSSDGLDVTLVWVGGDGDDKTVVFVSDSREGAYFEIPAQPYLALDVYYTRSRTETPAPSTTSTAASRRSPMVAVGTYPTRSDAELGQAVLAAAGIDSVIAADDAGGAYPFDLTGGARLFVGEADAADAATVLGDPSHAQGEEQL